MSSTLNSVNPSPLEAAKDAVKSFGELTTDEKLGLLWVLYDNMGGSITPAAPGAANPQFTQTLLGGVRAMEQKEQLEFMRNLVEKNSTEYTRQYSAFTKDNKLVFWYELALLMTEGEVIPMPRNYSLPSAASELFNTISQMEFNDQITVLRDAVIDMGPAA